MQDIKKRKIEITVLKETETALKRAGVSVGFSIGEVIDRMVLDWQSADTYGAAQIILEDFIMKTRHLTDAQIAEALFFVLNVLKNCDNDFSTENIKKSVGKQFEMSNEI